MIKAKRILRKNLFQFKNKIQSSRKISKFLQVF